VEKLRLHGHEAFFAGGWVRDFLLRRKPKDIDIATSALPDEVRRLFPNARPIGAQFGVVQVPIYGHTYEVATFRSDDAYLDGRRPSSVTFSGPEQDALRRDFTVNGLFFDPLADRLIDYVHGRNDIQRRLIRTIGNPGERFAEDKLRMLRAIRLACDLGFTIVPETWKAIQSLAPEILQVSWERIRDELTRILTGPAPALGLDLLRDSGLLRQLLPEVEAMCGISHSDKESATDVYSQTRAAITLLRKPGAALAFGTLLHDVGKAAIWEQDAAEPIDRHAEVGARIAEDICRRLKMSNEDTNRVADLVRAHVYFSKVMEMRESALKRFLRKPGFSDHLELYRVNCLSSRRDLEIHAYILQKLEEYRDQLNAGLLISGDDLIRMGYSPGPAFREILRTVEDLQLEGRVRTREEALEYVQSAFPLTGGSGSIERPH